MKALHQPIPIGAGPSAIVAGPHGTEMYAVNTFSQDIAVINSLTLAVRRSSTYVGRGPRAVAIVDIK
jgi:YVTN family beta-propeller protein